MNYRLALLLLSSLLLSGCTSIFGGSSSPGLAYVGDLAQNRVAREGETIAYAKSDDGADTYIYVFKGVDGKGGIHIEKLLRPTQTGGRRTGLASWFSDDGPTSTELVFLPEQTMLVSPGVHVVFISSVPGELQYRVIMTSG